MIARRVFLTGASGFVGAHVHRALERRGLVVRALVHRNDAVLAPAELVRGTLERPHELEPALADCDAVVHAGALLDPIDDPAAAERVNHAASVELARAAAKAGAKSFVFISSMAAIGYHADAGLLSPAAVCHPT